MRRLGSTTSRSPGTSDAELQFFADKLDQRNLVHIRLRRYFSSGTDRASATGGDGFAESNPLARIFELVVPDETPYDAQFER
ncbi:MAG: hypothetical protein A3H32_02905 [Betaproteobacteria bacterium RIFCSPLOWO2_02_FULL_63_19]|nr:MAG: hypothetical protein A3H32_02905 [Betaproteobacteria bacterium RIFCSPLOWO2_02_FULL_63_19]